MVLLLSGNKKRGRRRINCRLNQAIINTSTTPFFLDDVYYSVGAGSDRDSIPQICAYTAKYNRGLSSLLRIVIFSREGYLVPDLSAPYFFRCHP